MGQRSSLVLVSMSQQLSPERRKYKRNWMREWRQKNPAKALTQSRIWDLRKMARAEAKATGEPIEEVYIRFGVPTIIHLRTGKKHHD